MTHPRSETLRAVRVIALALAVLSFASRAGASPNARIDVSVLTMGPGDPVFSKFGHDALVVRPPRARRALVYNYGTFTLDDPELVSHFLHKDLRYWLGVSSFETTVEDYTAQNRLLLEQRLALDAGQARELASALATNAQPENRNYAYDYFRDNCATRVRDALDRVLHGALRRTARAHGSMTYRDYALRAAATDLPLYLGLDYGLSGYADQPLREWAELFLPQKLAELLRRVRVTGRSGRSVPLVKSERVLFRPKRAPLPGAPPRRLAAFVLSGLALGALFGALSWARRKRGTRGILAALLAILGLVLGALGGLLVFFWTATEHRAAWANLNLLFTPPWLVAYAIAAPLFAAHRRWGARLMRVLALATAATSLLGIALLPFVAQHAERIAGLLAPIWFSLAAVELSAMRNARRNVTT